MELLEEEPLSLNSAYTTKRNPNSATRDAVKKRNQKRCEWSVVRAGLARRRSLSRKKSLLSTYHPSMFKKYIAEATYVASGIPGSSHAKNHAGIIRRRGICWWCDRHGLVEIAQVNN